MIKITTKYYNRSNNFKAPIKKEPKPYNPYSYRSEIIEPKRYEEDKAIENNERQEIAELKESSSLGLSLKTDDLLLIGLIILLLPKAKDNLLLIIGLGYLLVSGMDT